LKLIYAPAALDDLDLIEEFISESSLETALRLGDNLRHCCELIAKTPEIGPARDELQPGLRYFPHVESNYLLFYRIREDTVEIARVLHGSLDYARHFN